MGESRRWTWKDIMHMPEKEMPEIVDGKPYYRAAPRFRHGMPAMEIGAVLAPLRRRHQGGWWIAADVDIRLAPDSIVRPDLCGYRKDRVPEPPEAWPLDVVPDWVCEILSPSNAGYDRRIKGTLYAQAAIPWFWLIHPQERTVEVMELCANHWILRGCYTDGDQLALPPFDDCVIEVTQLFGGPLGHCSQAPSASSPHDTPPHIG